MLPGEGLTVLKIGTEIPVEEVYAKFGGGTLGGLPHQLVILVGADEQGGGEAVEAQFFGLFRRLKQPDLVALAAAIPDILSHSPDERPQGVVILLDEGQVDGLGVLAQAVAPGAIFGEGMDVGIEPEAADFDFIPPEHLNALVGTGRTANVQ